jgi:tetratricopeptide (TPR) repeat protein
MLAAFVLSPLDAGAQGADEAYADALAKGEKAFVTRDFGGALTAFQQATQLRPDDPLAYYRLGEAQLALEKLPEAEAAWKSAQAKSAEATLAAKVLFVLADLRERQQKWQDAKDAWTAYTAFLEKNPKAIGYPQTAAERQKQIERRVKLEADYGEVKKRAENRIKQQKEEAESEKKK